MNDFEAYLLNWDNHQENLVRLFNLLLQSGHFVDVTLFCEGRRIRAHRVVLSACSPYFHTLFRDNPGDHPTVILSDIKFMDLCRLINFMYKGTISVPKSDLESFYTAANLLKINGLPEQYTSAQPRRSSSWEQEQPSAFQPVKKPRLEVDTDPSGGGDQCDAITITRCPPENEDEQVDISHNYLFNAHPTNFLACVSKFFWPLQGD